MEHVRSVHARLQKAATTARVETDDERRALLLDLIEAHERRLGSALDEASPTGSEGVMNVRLQYPEDGTLESLVRDLPDDPSPDIPLDEVIDEALEVESKLTRAYALLAAHSSAERVRSFFGRMAQLGNDAHRRRIRAELQPHDA